MNGLASQPVLFTVVLGSSASKLSLSRIGSIRMVVARVPKEAKC